MIFVHNLGNMAGCCAWSTPIAFCNKRCGAAHESKFVNHVHHPYYQAWFHQDYDRQDFETLTAPLESAVLTGNACSPVCKIHILDLVTDRWVARTPSKPHVLPIWLMSALTSHRLLRFSRLERFPTERGAARESVSYLYRIRRIRRAHFDSFPTSRALPQDLHDAALRLRFQRSYQSQIPSIMPALPHSPFQPLRSQRLG